MALTRRNCMNHPERAAIGICVITQKPICGECATRIDGVNYSKEGLRILQERRNTSRGKVDWKARLFVMALVIAVPFSAALLFQFYEAGLHFMVDMDQMEW
ncbi:hypothetical protein K2Y11_24105 [bacterium]|nr:hypothetical protein [bacterium]